MSSTALALLNGAVLSVPLTAAVWLVLCLAPRRALNASTRYAIWWVTLAVALALPLFLGEQRPVPAERHVSGGQPSYTIVHMGEAPRPAPSSGLVRVPVAGSVRTKLRWLPFAWLLASTILLWRLLMSHAALRRACTRTIAPPVEWRDRLEGWRAAAGRRRDSLRIVASTDIPVPFAAGLWRPAIVIPAGLFHRLSPADLDRIGLHEAAHLARFDDAAILAERLLLAIFPWHPAAWWMVRQIDREREIACDDRVVDATGSPKNYADCLTRVVELCGGVRGSLAAAGLSGHWAHLSRRVELLVATPRHARPRILAAPVVSFVLGLAILATAGPQLPRLVAFTAPVGRIPVPIAQQPEKPMTSPSIKKIGRKVVVAAAVTAAIATSTSPIEAAAPEPQAQVQAASGRNIAFLVDTVGLSSTELQRGISVITRFVDAQMRADDKVALIVATDQGIRVRQDFTKDREKLSQAIAQISTLPEPGIGLSPKAADHRATFAEVVRMLSGIQGKKELISIASGTPAPTPEELQKSLSEFQRAYLTVYAVDVAK